MNVPRHSPAAAVQLDVAGGIGLIGWALGTMHHRGTSPMPTEPTTTLVTDGPFRFTRNPIYLGMTMAYIGLAMMSRRWGPLATLPGVLTLVQSGVVRREERYLARKFGEAYQRYQAAVPQWLRFI